MAQINWTKTGYLVGIAFGIIFETAFIFSQLIFPFVLGRPSVVETPDVTGLGLVQAKRILQQEKLHVVVKDSLFSETAKAEEVLEQAPKAGSRIKEDGTVLLIISKGSKMVQVPDVTGYSFQEALLAIRAHDLRSSIVDSLYSDTAPRNAVMRTVPMGGSKVEKNSTVRLYLSKGPQAPPDTTFVDDIDY